MSNPNRFNKLRNRYRIGKVEWLSKLEPFRYENGAPLHCRRCGLTTSDAASPLLGGAGRECRYVTREVQSSDGTYSRDLVMVPGPDGDPIPQTGYFLVGRYNYHQACENSYSKQHRRTPTQIAEAMVAQFLAQVKAQVKAQQAAPPEAGAALPDPALPSPAGPVFGRYGQGAGAAPHPSFISPPIPSGHHQAIINKLNNTPADETILSDSEAGRAVAEFRKRRAVAEALLQSLSPDPPPDPPPPSPPDPGA